MQKTEGLYRDGNSFIHRTDARVKLILGCILVVCLFSSFNPLRIALIAVLWGLCAVCARQPMSGLWRILRLLKWLLLFSLLLHLFFTPGRTLLGLRWLSLDGLVNGLCVDAQIVLAVLFSLLISATTKPEHLASGIAGLLSPLRIVRVPVAEIGAMLILVLHFFPMIKAEVAHLRPQKVNSGKPLLTRLKEWSEHLEVVLLKLLDQGDGLAHDIVTASSGGYWEGEGGSCPAMGRSFFVSLIVGLIIVSPLWWV